MARQPGRRCHLHGPNGPYRRFAALDQIPGFDYLVLYELFVRQAYRRRGIGAQLLR